MARKKGLEQSPEQKSPQQLFDEAKAKVLAVTETEELIPALNDFFRTTQQIPFQNEWIPIHGRLAVVTTLLGSPFAADPTILSDLVGRQQAILADIQQKAEADKVRAENFRLLTEAKQAMKPFIPKEPTRRRTPRK